MTVQQMGGAETGHVVALMDKGMPVTPVATDGADPKDAVGLLDQPGPVDIRNPALPGEFVNFLREDDWSATAYFYLDRPINALPALQPVEERAAGL